MFSGGLLSRNLGQRKNRNVAHQKIRKSKERTRKEKENFKILKENGLINWDDISKKGKRSSLNKQTTYSIEVAGKIHLLSYEGGFALLGFTITVISVIVTWVKHSFLYGPIGIGVGMYLLICSVTVLFENKVANNKLYHVHDIYTQYNPSHTEEATTTIADAPTQGSRKPCQICQNSRITNVSKIPSRFKNNNNINILPNVVITGSDTEYDNDFETSEDSLTK